MVKEAFRKEILDILLKYSRGSTDAFIEKVIEDTWSVEIIKEIIREASVSQLHGNSVAIILVSHWCLNGANMLYRMNDISMHSISLFPADYCKEGGVYLEHALEARDINIFFDWYEREIMTPLGFTRQEMYYLYELIEDCCVMLCRKMRGVDIKRSFKRPDWDGSYY